MPDNKKLVGDPDRQLLDRHDHDEVSRFVKKLLVQVGRNPNDLSQRAAMRSIVLDYRKGESVTFAELEEYVREDNEETERLIRQIVKELDG